MEQPSNSETNTSHEKTIKELSFGQNMTPETVQQYLNYVEKGIIKRETFRYALLSGLYQQAWDGKIRTEDIVSYLEMANQLRDIENTVDFRCPDWEEEIYVTIPGIDFPAEEMSMEDFKNLLSELND